MPRLEVDFKLPFWERLYPSEYVRTPTDNPLADDRD